MPASSALLLISVGLAAAWLLEPPSPEPAAGPAALFSSGRALRHVEAIARKPHPATTEENRFVREYILAELRTLGFQPQIEESQMHFVQLTLRNITARLPGQASTGTVLLAAHYDSRDGAPGAGDDAAGVAAILETLRALKEGQPLQNDIFILITDAEEWGMLGAEAFALRTDLSPERTLVLNFEARGNCGASILFETSEGNGRIIGEALRAAPWPVANSLSQAVYNLLPNDTDLSVLKKHGFSGLNFAFIDGVSAYHKRRDSPENLCEASLQHHGSYALALARHFGNLEQPALRASNVVYFNAVGRLWVCYPRWLVLPLTAMATGIFGVIWVRERNRGRATVRGSLLGVAAFSSSVIDGAGIPAGAAWIAGQAASRLARFDGTVPWRGFGANAAFVFGLWICVLGLARRFHRGKALTPADAHAGALGLVLCLLWAATLWLEGATPFLLWPFVFGTLGSLASRREAASAGLRILVLGLATPAALLLGPTAYYLFLGMAHQTWLAVLAASFAIVLWAGCTPWLVHRPTANPDGGGAAA